MGNSRQALGLIETFGLVFMLEAADARTSRLGRMIKDQPDLTLPPPYVSWMEKHVPGFVSDS